MIGASVTTVTDDPSGTETPPRVNPPYVADEATMLRAYLDSQRETFRRKTRGLTQAEMGQRLLPSTLTLAGLVKHLALVEDWWFSVNLADRPAVAPFHGIDWDATPDWEFETAVDDQPEQLHALYDGIVADCDAHLDAALADGGPDAVAARRHPRTGEEISVRWLLLHMIEEYARHNGHADLLREAVDGSTGE